MLQEEALKRDKNNHAHKDYVYTIVLLCQTFICCSSSAGCGSAVSLLHHHCSFV